MNAKHLTASGWTCEGAVYVHTDRGRRPAEIVYRHDDRYMVVWPGSLTVDSGSVGDGAYKQLQSRCEPMAETTMSVEAARNLDQAGSNPNQVRRAWDGGDFGMLCDSDTTEAIRPATPQEAMESAETAQGHITVGGRRCYVEP